MPTAVLPTPNSLSSSALLSSLSSCASGVYSIKLIDLLLAAHSQVTEREVDFTLLVMDGVIHLSNRPYAGLPAYMLQKAARVPGLVHALASSPGVKSSVDCEDAGLVFERLVRRVMLQYCHLERGFTTSSHQQAVEYLTHQPSELVAKHAQYRMELARIERGAKATARADAHERKVRSGLVASVSFWKLKSKKKRPAAK